MKRRDILRTGALAGLGLALSSHYFFAKGDTSQESSLFRFVLLGDVGTENIENRRSLMR